MQNSQCYLYAKFKKIGLINRIYLTITQKGKISEKNRSYFFKKILSIYNCILRLPFYLI